MTLSLPAGHTLDVVRPPDHDGRPCMVAQTSCVWVRLDGGAWTPALERSTRAVIRRWLDLSLSDIPAAWEDTTGERIGHTCEGCGVRSVDARVVDGSDCYWCPSCR